MRLQPHRSGRATTVRAASARRVARARGTTRAPDERGVTVAQLLTATVAVCALAVAVFAFTRSGGTHTSPSTAAETPIRPVLAALQRDVAVTVHALPSDPNGCGHAPGQRAVVSFLSEGSAAVRASWYVAPQGRDTVLLRRMCRNGVIESSSVLGTVSGTPLVACTPKCGTFDTVRFSYTGPHGLTSVVAYRKGRP